MENNLPVGLVQHLENIGCLPRSHDEDGVNDLDNTPPRVFEYNQPELDENGEPPF